MGPLDELIRWGDCRDVAGGDRALQDGEQETTVEDLSHVEVFFFQHQESGDQ